MKLGPSLLKRAMKAVHHHGYGTFFPEPPELEIIRDNQPDVLAELANIDLDTYPGYDYIVLFAPKSRLSIRSVSLLHPYDFVFYTALVLALKTSIAKSRLPRYRVFSYRTEGTSSNVLYRTPSFWKEFRATIERRATNDSDCVVGVTDIGDFFPRIYHHRLVNALDVACGDSAKEYVRLLEKMLGRFSGGTSYGIPVGPPASRLLGEAVLIDVDSTLQSFGIDFIRFVDDYVIFADTVQDAEYGIRILAETLYRNHGLTLQTAKTRVSTAKEYVERHLTIHSEKEINRRKLLEIFGDDEYDIKSYEELDAHQQREIDAFNLSGMLEEALLEGENVDYREVQFILGRLSALRKPDLIPTVVKNLERLYPVAESVAAFFGQLTDLSDENRRTVAEALLAPILNAGTAKPSEYYSMWALSIFSVTGSWDHAEDLLRIFREATPDAIRRFAALALAKSGSRPQAMAMRDYLTTGSSLCRSAMLLATAKLGRDERKHFGRSLRISDSLEKLCIRATI